MPNKNAGAGNVSQILDIINLSRRGDRGHAIDSDYRSCFHGYIQTGRPRSKETIAHLVRDKYHLCA